MNQYVDNILHAFALLADDHDQLQRISTLATELEWADAESVATLLEKLALLAPSISPVVLDRALEVILQRLTKQADSSVPVTEVPIVEEPTQIEVASPQILEAISDLYNAIPAETRARNYLLNWLAQSDSVAALNTFTELMVVDPPTCETSMVVAFAPLLKRGRSFPVDGLFPELFSALQHRSVAAAILDLANFVTRTGRVEQHPGRDHAGTLAKMLGLLTEQLSMIEEGNLPETQSPADLSRMINDTVSLIASLCDSLALIGDKDSMGKLSRAADLKHRRIRAEALAALIRLGHEDAGRDLAALAAEPVARLRVLNYADELGLADQVDEQFASSAARAESELAIWLANPANMGLAPTKLFTIDQRQLAWPGYDDVVECFLIQYEYELGSSRIENVGIVGPITHAFSLNLVPLPIADIYAAFAGWQCLHDEINELTIDQADRQHPGLVPRLLSRLASEALDGLPMNEVEPVFVGEFMGEPVLVAEGIRHGKHGSLLVDRDEVTWFDPDSGQAPGRNELAWAIYKGRRVMAAFNDPDVWPGVESETE